MTRNLVRVFNLTTKKNRIYNIPVDATTGELIKIKKGTIVDVEFKDEATTALGIATADSWLVGDEEYAAIRNAIGRDPDGEFKSVRATYIRNEIPVEPEILDGEEEDEEEVEG